MGLVIFQADFQSSLSIFSTSCAGPGFDHDSVISIMNTKAYCVRRCPLVCECRAKILVLASPQNQEPDSIPAIRIVETWSVQGVPLGMYAPAFLSLNKKQAKSHDILKAKRLGSIDWRFLGLQNTLDPEALRLSMVPNINIPLLLVQGGFQTNHFWYPKSWKNYKLCSKSIKKRSFYVF